MWQISYIVIHMVAYIIYSDRLDATWVKCHLVANNPGGIYQGNLSKIIISDIMLNGFII